MEEKLEALKKDIAVFKDNPKQFRYPRSIKRKALELLDNGYTPKELFRLTGLGDKTLHNWKVQNLPSFKEVRVSNTPILSDFEVSVYKSGLSFKVSGFKNITEVHSFIGSFK